MISHYHIIIIMYQSISTIEHFFFSFPSYFFIDQLNFRFLTCLTIWAKCSLESSVTFHLVSKFLFFVLFGCRESSEYITLLQCVWIGPHSSSLTNVENWTSHFRQSVQIWCREEQREENSGKWKAFCVTHKHNNASINSNR